MCKFILKFFICPPFLFVSMEDVITASDFVLNALCFRLLFVISQRTFLRMVKTEGSAINFAVKGFHNRTHTSTPQHFRLKQQLNQRVPMEMLFFWTQAQHVNFHQ